MKITQMWKRNTPTTMSGYSITVTYIYSSFKKEEIDELEKRMPEGILVAEFDKENINQNDKTI